MSFCANCGSKLADGAKFCFNCGNSVNSELYSQRKQEYGGKIVKCPECGEILESFALNCPNCGHELRGAKVSSIVKEFAKEIEQIESSGQVGYESKRINFIRTFPIPNTKEDLFEFIILAGSNIREDRYDEYISEENEELSDAWRAKFEQAYNKAKISFRNQQDFKEIESLYYEKVEQQKTAKRRSIIRNNISNIKYAIAYCFLMSFLVLMVVFVNKLTARETEKENERLDVIVEEVYEAIESENYKLARAKVATLIFSKSDTDAIYKWDKTREELYAVIDAAEKEYAESNMYVEIDAENIDLPSYNSLNQEEISKLVFDEGTYQDITLEDYVFSIPHHWDEEGSKDEYYQAYSEKDGKVAMLSIAYPTDGEDEVNLQALLDDNDNMIKTIEAMFNNCEVTESKRYCSNYGIDGMLYSFTFRDGTLFNKYDASGNYYCFPSEYGNRWFFVMLTQTDNAEKDYTDEYMKILSSIRKAEEK